MEFAYSRCFGQYGCTGLTSYPMGEQPIKQQPVQGFLRDRFTLRRGFCGSLVFQTRREREREREETSCNSLSDSMGRSLIFCVIVPYTFQKKEEEYSR